jgi:radical SAM superfamily enzyme YgiQ (UPF0313 family)
MATFLFVNVNHEVGPESSESIPVSPGYILATLREHGSRGLILDDLRGRSLSLKHLERWIRSVEPQVIGFTAYQSTMDRVLFFCNYIKSRHRAIRIALGGPQIIAMPAQALEELDDVDILVRGEGETVMLDIAQALDKGLSLEDVGGIVCRSKGKIVETGPGRQAPDDLDEYASPYLTGTLNLEEKDTAILISSRGCRHVCLFCITPGICNGKVRFHSIERTLEEMRVLTERGISRFWFADPNFTEDRERTVRLLEEKVARNITTPFWCQSRSDLVDEELIRLLAKAGADTLAFGLESGSPGVLARTNKGIELAQVAEHVKLVQSLGMEAELFTIFGLPGETVEDARRTLEFVSSLGIPIASNSGSQQMQLYFGSIYNRHPERFGFKPRAVHRPAYLSVGDDYHTDQLTEADLKCIRNIWSLANEQMEVDVYQKQRIFDVIEFLLENREDLKTEVKYWVFGALATSAIEEFGLLLDFLKGLEDLEGRDGETLGELLSSLTFFSETDAAIGPMDRVIFDSRSWMDGVPFTGISGKYWDVLLGRGLLLDEFENGFQGKRQGEEIVFDFVFPADYGHEELRLKRVEVHAKIHKVFHTVSAGTVDEVRNLDVRNDYSTFQLDVLSDHNEILYYLALRDADRDALLREPRHFLMLVYRLAKLGKRDAVNDLADLVKGKPTALKALADTLAGSGRFEWALEYYAQLSEQMPSTLIKQAKCMLNLDRPQEALKLLETVSDDRDLEYQQTLLTSLVRATPRSHRIQPLWKQVMNQRVDLALERERMPRQGQGAFAPVVHGLDKLE